MKPATQVIHAGRHPRQQGEPLASGVTFAGTYAASGDPAKVKYNYGRYHNPTWSAFEQALGELEGGSVLCFASGMAAITAVLDSALQPGDVIVLPEDSYYTARLLADGVFSRMGVTIRKAPTAENRQLSLIHGARLLWLETPSNPGLAVCDVAAAVEAAHRHGTLVAVDNTTATVLGQNPVAFGADFSVSSDTKALTGHSDLVLGHVAVRDKKWNEKLQAFRNLTGAIPGPMEVWLAHRSLGTLEMRLERQTRNALALAEYLRTRDDVAAVRYPGLPDDPAYAIAVQQMRFFGPVLTFTLRNQELAERFLANCKLVVEATSFGGLHTTAERRGRWGGDKVPDGFIRVSVGCEDAADIVADFAAALDAV
jgi:cystathionine gamma-lyase